jgi:hypothetical protein
VRTNLRQLIIILAILSFANCKTKSSDNKNSLVPVGDTLTPFNIVVYSGDEAIEKFEINVYKKADKFYADNITPYYYYGKQTDSIWTIELDQFKISTCNKFLNKAKSLPKECPEFSSSIKDYTIALINDTIKIKGDCNWDSLDFFSLRQLLFKDKFQELESKKTNLINDLNNKIIGKWYFKPLSLPPNRGEYFILTRNNDLNSECYWEFGNEYLFKSSFNKYFGFKYSDKYKWQVDGDVYLTIQPGIITDKDGSMTVGNDGATFILDKLMTNEIRLKFLWR